MSLAHSYSPCQSTPKRTKFSARLALGISIGFAALTGAVVLPVTASAAPAGHHAATTAQHRASSRATRARARREASVSRFNARARKVIAEAARQKGKPYVYGADGPHSFDCSGLVRYVFLHALHKSLPHNAAEQYAVSHHIRRRDLRVGDLVFVDNGGHVSHVGIYAGHNHWWVAPHTGTRVYRQAIYHSRFVYGRVISWKRA